MNLILLETGAEEMRLAERVIKRIETVSTGEYIVERPDSKHSVKTRVRYVGDGCDRWHTHVHTDKGTQCWDKGYPVEVAAA